MSSSPRLATSVRRVSSHPSPQSQRPPYPEIWRRAPGTVAVKVVSQLLAATRARSHPL